MRKIYLISCLCAVLFALSCNSHQEVELAPAPVSVQLEDQSQFIERGLAQLQLSDAEKVAQRFMLKDAKKPFTVSAATRADQMTAVRDSAGNPLMYVVNFEQGGFCIVSATKKSYPILAHGDEGFFDLSRIDESGVCLWLEEMEYGITHQDTLSEAERIFLNSAWREYEKGFDMAETRAYGDQNDPRFVAFCNRMSYYMNDGNGDAIPLNGAIITGLIPDYVISGAQYAARNAGCPEEYVIIVRAPNDHIQTIGPLVKTNWHQKHPYNNGCFTLRGEKAVAGCVAIAVGQIMNFYQHPHDFYDWRGIAAGNETHLANFVADVGKSVGMNYGVTGSNANDGQALGALVGKFKYSAKLIYTEPLSEIAFHRPYYSAGTSSENKGHAWVVNGTKTYITNTQFRIDCQVFRNGQYAYEANSGYDYGYASRDPMHKETHINWGGEASDLNTWYAAGNHTQADGNSDYSRNRAYITINPIDRKPLPGDGPIIPPPAGGDGPIIAPPSGGGTVIPPIGGGSTIIQRD